MYSIGLNEQSTLVFTLIIHVIFYKIYLELEGRSELSIIFTGLTLLFYYFIVFLISVNYTIIAALSDGNLRSLAKYTFFSIDSLVIISTGPIAIVIPDFIFHSLRLLKKYKRHVKYEKKALEMARIIVEKENEKGKAPMK